MTDNGPGYIARLFRKALRMLAIRHIRTRPYTPKTTDVIDKSFLCEVILPRRMGDRVAKSRA